MVLTWAVQWPCLCLARDPWPQPLPADMISQLHLGPASSLQICLVMSSLQSSSLAQLRSSHWFNYRFSVVSSLSLPFSLLLNPYLFYSRKHMKFCVECSIFHSSFQCIAFFFKIINSWNLYKLMGMKKRDAIIRLEMKLMDWKCNMVKCSMHLKHWYGYYINLKNVNLSVSFCVSLCFYHDSMTACCDRSPISRKTSSMSLGSFYSGKCFNLSFKLGVSFDIFPALFALLGLIWKVWVAWFLKRGLLLRT